MGKPCGMPGLPDISVHIETLDARIRDAPLDRVRLRGAFLLPPVHPKPEDATSQTGGKPLAGQSISHLLKPDWLPTLTEIEEMSINTR